MLQSTFRNGRQAVAAATLVMMAAHGPAVQAEEAAGARPPAPGLLDVVQETLRTNPEVLAGTYERRAADHRVDQAAAGFQPTVELNVARGKERTRSTTTNKVKRDLNRNDSSLTLTQPLFDGFETSSRVQASEARVESAAFSLANTSERIALRAIEVYLNYQRNMTLKTHAESNLELHNTIYDQIELRSRQGVTTQVNLEQIEGRRALSQSDLVRTQSQIDDSGYRFQRVVGYLPYELAPPPAMDCRTLPGSVDEALKMMAAVHPALDAARASLRAAYSDEEVALAAMYPDVTFEAQINKNNDIDGTNSINENTLAMLRMAYSVYTGGRDIARVRELMHFTDQALERYNQLKRQAEEEVRLAWNSLEALEKRAPQLQRRMETAEATQSAYSKQFNIGQRTLLDLLDVGREAFTAKSEFADVEYDRMFAIFRLLTAMGILLESIGVKPPSDAMLQRVAHDGEGGASPHDPHLFSAFFSCGKTF